MFKTKNGRLIMQSKCADCGFKNSRFVKEQEAKALFSSLDIITRLSKTIVWWYIFLSVWNEWNCEQIFTARW